MTNFFFHDRAGKILMCGNCGDHEISAQKLSGAELKIGLADCENNYCSEGEVLTFPEKPTEFHVWDWPSLTWKQDRALAEKAVRAKRATLLAASDWTQLPDVPLETKAAWATNRQALRDITEQDGFPFDVIWPTAPQ